MEFIYIDLALLAIVCIFAAIFLIKNRKKLEIQSKIILIYKTKIGIKFINWATKVLSPVMPLLTWLSITFGFLFMISMFALLIWNLIILLTTPIDIFPLVPILPYVPQALDLPLLPDFYFIHWIIAIVILAVTHEAAHGIFSSFYKIKIKSTGFGFIGPILTAFVEPEERVLSKRNAKQQLSIFAAGSVANFIFGIIFILLFHLFLIATYAPAGVGGYVFMYGPVNVSEIDSIGNYSLNEFLELSDEELQNMKETLTVRVDEETYYLTPELIKAQITSKEESKILVVFHDTPAFRENLSGGIQQINGQEIKNVEDINKELSKYSPGDEIIVTTSVGTYNIILEENPKDPSKGYLGIGFFRAQSPVSAVISRVLYPYFNPDLHIEPRFNQDTLNFISGLFIWLIIIFFGVALFNMLPLGFLDGGRFIYVFAFALTKSKKKAMRIFKISSSLVLLILLLMVLSWAI